MANVIKTADGILVIVFPVISALGALKLTKGTRLAVLTYTRKYGSSCTYYVMVGRL